MICLEQFILQSGYYLVRVKKFSTIYATTKKCVISKSRQITCPIFYLVFWWSNIKWNYSLNTKASARHFQIPWIPQQKWHLAQLGMMMMMTIKIKSPRVQTTSHRDNLSQTLKRCQSKTYCWNLSKVLPGMSFAEWLLSGPCQKVLYNICYYKICNNKESVISKSWQISCPWWL